MKRILSLLLCAVIACTFSGCSLFKPLKSTFRIQGGEDSGVIYTEHKTDTGYYDDVESSESSESVTDSPSSNGSSSSSSSSNNPSGSASENNLSGRYYYDNMNSGQQVSYKAIYNAVSAMSDEYIEVPNLRELGDVVLAYTAVRNDYPEFFWLGGNFKWIIKGDTFYIQAAYTCTAEEAEVMQKQLDAASAEYVKGVSGLTDDYEKELAAFRWLTARATYDDATAAAPYDDSSDRHAFSAYGAIVKRTDVNGETLATAVCEGYSRAFSLLLSKVGIQSTVVSGTLNNEPHMWNIVKIGGEWYNVDTTVSDTDDTERYLLFNVTDASIADLYLWDADFSFADFSESENISSFNFKLPSCTATVCNYLSRAGKMIDPKDTSVIDELVLKAYENGETSCEFAVADGVDFAYSSETVAEDISFPKCVSLLMSKKPGVKVTLSGIPGTKGFVIYWN